MIEVKVSFETASNSCIDLFEGIQEGDVSSKESKRTSKSLQKLKKYFSTSKEQTPTITVCDGDSCKIVEGPSSASEASESSSPIESQSGRAEATAPAKTAEYLMHIKGKVPAKELDTDIDKKKVNLIIIVDVSGSMGGGPIRQVNSALKKIIDLTENSPHVANRHIMIYNHEAKWLENDIGRDLRAGGSTDFVSVFTKLQDMLVKVGQEERPQGLWEPSGIEASGLSLDKNNSTYVLMMTDGCDTVNNQQQIDKAKEKLQVAIEGYGGEVVFNVLGFSDSHDDNFLNLLSLIGTSDGSYNFVSPREGDSALQEILVGMVSDFSTSIGRLMNLEVKSMNMEFLGKWFQESSKEAVLAGHMTKHSGDMIHISTHKFVRMPIDQEPDLEIKAAESLFGDAKLETRIVEMKKEVWSEAKNPNEVRLFQLRKMRAAMNMVSTKLSEATATPDPLAKAVHSKIKTQVEAFKNMNENTEVKRLGDALKAMVLQCDEVFTPKPDVSVDHLRMQSRAQVSRAVYSTGPTGYSNQIQNAFMSRARFSSSSQPSTKSRAKQSRMVHTDYTNRSDSEDSD